MENVRLDILTMQMQINSCNNVIDLTNGIIESMSKALCPEEGSQLTYDFKTDTMLRQISTIFPRKNKAMYERDVIFKERCYYSKYDIRS